MRAAVQPDAAVDALVGDEIGAKLWLTQALGVSRETLGQLERFAHFVEEQAARQNLVSAASLPHIWQRHIVDSAQLLRFASPRTGQCWMDLGSGAGFPGLVIALLVPCQMVLVESRALRIAYLEQAIALLGLQDRVRVAGMPLERVETFAADFISARAFAPLPRLLEGAARFSTGKTRWLLPKGRNAVAELESIDPAWHDVFHVKHSITDPDAAILVGTGHATPQSPQRRPSAKAARRHRRQP